jgi:hypothetical protein
MILVTRSWEMLFPTVLVHKIPREYSDHNPLIMVSGNRFFFCIKVENSDLSWLVWIMKNFYLKLRRS